MNQREKVGRAIAQRIGAPCKAFRSLVARSWSFTIRIARREFFAIRRALQGAMWRSRR